MLFSESFKVGVEADVGHGGENFVEGAHFGAGEDGLEDGAVLGLSAGAFLGGALFEGLNDLRVEISHD